jgi:hypothetical protein
MKQAAVLQEMKITFDMTAFNNGDLSPSNVYITFAANASDMIYGSGLTKETINFSGGNITLRAEHKFDCTSFFVHCAVQVLTRLPDFDVGLIHSIQPFSWPGCSSDQFGDIVRGHIVEGRNSRDAPQQNSAPRLREAAPPHRPR